MDTGNLGTYYPGRGHSSISEWICGCWVDNSNKKGSWSVSDVFSDGLWKWFHCVPIAAVTANHKIQQFFLLTVQIQLGFLDAFSLLKFMPGEEGTLE